MIALDRGGLHRLLVVLQTGMINTPGGVYANAAYAQGGIDVLVALLDPASGGDIFLEEAEAEAEAEAEEEAEEEAAEASEEPGAKVPSDPAPAEEPSATQQAKREGSPWNPDRDAMLLALWPQSALTVAEILTRINALPGAAAVARRTSLYSEAKRLGLPTVRNALPTDLTEPTPDEADRREARDMILQGNAGAKALHEYFGWPLEFAQQFAAKVRVEA